MEKENPYLFTPETKIETNEWRNAKDYKSINTKILSTIRAISWNEMSTQSLSYSLEESRMNEFLHGML